MKSRLSFLYFLQFAIWGCYLPTLGQFLGSCGLGADIAWFYAAIGLVSVLTPTLFGRLADKTGRPETLLAICHFSGALVMFSLWQYAMIHPQPEFRILYPLYLLFLLLYMPTMALANTTTFGILSQGGKDPATSFPSIRIWGTVGFVAAMWFVNSAYWHDGTLGFAFSDLSDKGNLRFQYNAMQMLCSSCVAFVTALWSLSIPHVQIHNTHSNKTDSVPFSVNFKRMLIHKEIAYFLLFVIFTGVCLQISNGFVTPYITHFIGLEQYQHSLAAGNANILFSISQISEALCILFVGIGLKKYGIKTIYAIGIFAWSMRFLTLGFGNPDSGIWLLILSMAVYGIAFNFITIAGHLYIQRVAPANMKGFAQGFMMFLSNGIGATLGTLSAGSIVNKWCHWKMVTIENSGAPIRLFMGDWTKPWLIFAAYTGLILLAWLLFYKRTSTVQNSAN